MRKTLLIMGLVFMIFIIQVYAGDQPINGSIPVVGSNQTSYAHMLNAFFRVLHTEEGALKNITVYGDRIVPFINHTGSKMVVRGNISAEVLNATTITVKDIEVSTTVTVNGTNVQTIEAVFNKENYSIEYSGSGFKNANISDYLGGAGENASLIRIGNISSIFDANYSKEYSRSGFKLINFSSIVDNYIPSFFNIGNYTSLEDNAFRVINGTLLPFSNFQIANVSNYTQYIKGVDFNLGNISNHTSFPLSNFQLGNVSNYTQYIKGVDFNLGNISNNTIKRADNETIGLWNKTGTNIFNALFDVNVGIGTTSPNTKLTVIGGINASGGLNVTAGDVLLATTSGFVGIGTTGPEQRLTVQKADGESGFGSKSQLRVGHSANEGVYLTGSDINANALSFGGEFTGGDGVELFATNSWTARNNVVSVIADYSGSGLRFYTNGGLTTGNNFTPTERMRIDTSGKVGIGTSSPKTRLDIKNGSAISTIGSAGLLALVGQTGGSSVGNLEEIHFKTWDSSTNPQGVIGIVTTGTTSQERGSLYFATKNADDDAVPTEVMRITDTGNVGINTTSSNKALKVVGGFNASTTKDCEISTNSTCIILRCGGIVVLCPS